MQKIKIDLENCYGIKVLKEELDFSAKKASVIYAPNGIMKTSFAETFIDLSKERASKDRIYTDRVTKREITDENGLPLLASEIVVIRPYDQEYKSEKMSTLLVSKALKEEYDKIHLTINEKKEALIKALKILSGLNKNIEETISETFTKEKDKVLVALGRMEKEVIEQTHPAFSGISYIKIFNENVEEFLRTKDFKDKLEEYTKIYDQLLSGSRFFRKGVFNHYQADEIAKNLKTHGFFKAEHSIYVNSKSEKKEITTVEELEAMIQQEKESILSNSVLLKAFNEIDGKLKNQGLRDFREYILNNQTILPEFKNPELFKEKIWTSYLVETKDLFIALMEEYHQGKKRINEIIALASKEATEWQSGRMVFASKPAALPPRNDATSAF